MCASVMFTSDCCNLCRISNWKGVYVSKGGHTSNFEINSDQSNWMSAEFSTGLIHLLRLRFTPDFKRIVWATLEIYLDNISEWYYSFCCKNSAQTCEKWRQSAGVPCHSCDEHKIWKPLSWSRSVWMLPWYLCSPLSVTSIIPRMPTTETMVNCVITIRWH